MNLGRLGVIATNVFREVIRDRILYLLALFAIALAALAALLPQVAAGTENKILLDVGLATMNLLGLVVAIFVGTGLINKEIEKRTIYALIAKPVSKAEFIVGKHFGLSLVVLVLMVAMLLIYLGVLTYSTTSYPLNSILLATLFQLLELLLVIAIAILFGVFTSSLLAILLTTSVYLMGHASRDLVSLGILSKNPSLQHATEAIYLLLPDLERLNLKNQAVYGTTLLPPPIELLGSAAYGIFYTTVVLSIAILIFSKREF